DAGRASLPAARAALDAAVWLCTSTWPSAPSSGDGRMVEAPRDAGRPGAHRAHRRGAAWADHDAGLGAGPWRHAPHGGADVFGCADDRAADAVEDARRRDGRRRAPPRRAR